LCRLGRDTRQAFKRLWRFFDHWPQFLAQHKSARYGYWLTCATPLDAQERGVTWRTVYKGK
jgi:hypothetical protein